MRYGIADYKNFHSGGSVFPVQSSVLDEEALFSHIVNRYCIPTPLSCRFLSRGDADIYRVRTTTDNFYLKVYRPPRSLELTEAEASFVFALSASGLPVVKPVQRSDDRFASQVCAPEGTRPILLFEEAPPPLPAPLDETLLFQIGEQIAMLHVVADALDTDFGIPEIQSDVLLREHVYHMSRFLSQQDHAFLHAVSRQLTVVLERLPRKAPDFGLCHADLVMSNLRLSAEGTITIFDFGNVLKTWRAFEFATVYWSLSNRGRNSRDPRWKAFLHGYESIRMLPGALSEHLAVMLVLRQISFLGGNCATLPLRLGTEPFESDFIENGMTQLRHFVEESGIQNMGKRR